jgi:Uncharacterized conserved protein (DUF2285)
VDFDSLAAAITLHNDADGNTHIHLRRDGFWLHMFHAGAADLTGQTYVSFVVERPDRLIPVTHAVRQFSALIAPGIVKFPRAQSQFDNHLRRYIMALDANLAGHSHRDIACILHGEAYVASRWASPSRDLKATVRRAVRRGLNLRDGAYLKLLK